VDPGVRQITLPWSALLGDNAKYAPAHRGQKPVIILTLAYRTAKARAQLTIERQLIGLTPLEGPCSLCARMIEPDRRTRRDIANYAKLVHDALTGWAFVDDSQLDDVRWIRAGVDIDRPRLELTITAIRASTP
jgi:Holliday junction resolvase RusA-like endonuclease